MKFMPFIFLLVVAGLSIASTFIHPLKLTSSLIEYDSERKRISIQCRVFIDDFETTIDRFDNILNTVENRRTGIGFNASNITRKDEAKIEFYFEKCYRLKINDQNLKLVYETSQVNQTNNSLVLVFHVKEVSIEKGDELLIENTLFFEEFGRKQKNIMKLRIPPFIGDENKISTSENYFINYSF